MVTRYWEWGFTLVEMMFVIAIMVILAAIVTPNYQTFMAQRRLNGAARQIMSDLMHARMQAVSQNNEFKVIFPNESSENKYEYKILDDDDNDGNKDDAEVLHTGNIQTDYYDVTVLANSNVIFQPNGTASDYGTARVRNVSGDRYIIVSSAGRVRIDKVPPPGWKL